MGKPIVLGVDLEEYLVHITIRKKQPADINQLEKALGLI